MFTIDFWIFVSGLIISLTACFVFYNLNLHLSNFDALSRMNISRKITDNLIPGFGQFGSVWPFLPQLIMMPFVAIKLVWHTGIAGIIMSAPAFIISGYLMYLIIFDITKNKFIAIIGFLIFITNINLLLLQTMAMSELLFISLILGTMYGLLRWIRDPTHKILPLITAGACLSGASLTRYEGIAFSFASITAVALITYLKKREIKIAEGITILFATVSLFGLFIWCIYSLFIFKDPFYWEKIYTGQASIISTDIKKNAEVNKNTKKIITNFESKSMAYISAIADMSGIPIFFVGSVGFVGYLFCLKPWKDQRPLVILLPLSIIAFMFLTFYKSTLPIIAPPLSFKSINNFNTTYFTEFNIRYGILLWPFIVIMASWAVSKKKHSKLLIILIFIVHIVTPLYHRAFLIYQLPLVWNKGSAIIVKEYPARNWLKTNYNGGLILISALKHDPIMFQLGFAYRNYIHEGAGKYWLTSVNHPEVYADWIFMADPKDITGGAVAGEADPVTLNLQNNQTLKKYFIERYNDGHIDIYQKRLDSVFMNSINDKSFSISDIKFTGKIIDLKNKPVSNVVLASGLESSISSLDGIFAIDVKNGLTQVTFKKSGYQTLTFTQDFSQSIPYGHKIVMFPTRDLTFFEKILPYL